MEQSGLLCLLLEVALLLRAVSGGNALLLRPFKGRKSNDKKRTHDEWHVLVRRQPAHSSTLIRPHAYAPSLARSLLHASSSKILASAPQRVERACCQVLLCIAEIKYPLRVGKHQSTHSRSNKRNHPKQILLQKSRAVYSKGKHRGKP